MFINKLVNILCFLFVQRLVCCLLLGCKQLVCWLDRILNSIRTCSPQWTSSLSAVICPPVLCPKASETQNHVGPSWLGRPEYTRRTQTGIWETRVHLSFSLSLRDVDQESPFQLEDFLSSRFLNASFCWTNQEVCLCSVHEGLSHTYSGQQWSPNLN